MAAAPDRASPVVIVAGSVRYLERVALPRGAVLTVAVEDLSRAGAPDGILAKAAVPVDGQVPIAFLAHHRCRRR